MGFLKEFKAFAIKGNVMDMAVGVIIGGAFGKIVTSLVNDILMPPIGALMGNTDFSNLKVDLSAIRNAVSKAGDAVANAVSGGADAAVEAAAEVAPIYWNYGAFIQQCIDFLILAFCVFKEEMVYSSRLFDTIILQSCRPASSSIFLTLMDW